MNKQDQSPLISIIIPVYNAEKTLKVTIESIVSQSYNNFEILLVNDGSTDGSLIICNKLSCMDSRIKVFSQINGGVSSARNLGMDNIEGDFLTFVDADDILTPNALLNLVNRQIETQADIVFGCVDIIREHKKDVFYYSEGIISNDPCGYLANSPKKLSSCGYLLRSTIVRKNLIRQIVGLKTNEDGLFLMTAASYCNIVADINTIVYEYIINESSITQNPNYRMHSYMAFWASKLYFDLANQNINTSKESSIRKVGYSKKKLGFLLAFKGKCKLQTFLDARSDFFAIYSYSFLSNIKYWINALTAFVLIKRRNLIKFRDGGGIIKISIVRSNK